MEFKSFRDKVLKDFPELERVEKYNEILEKLMDLGRALDNIKSSNIRDIAFNKLSETGFWVKSCMSKELIDEDSLREVGVCKGCTVSVAGCPAVGGWDLEGFPLSRLGSRLRCHN